MAVFPVRFFGDPVLREKSEPVEELDGKIRVLSGNMAETMYKARGVGLAAPQIGVLKQVIVIDMGDDEFVAYINPLIIESSRSKDTEEEGCLCLPDIRVPVTRHKRVVVEALDLQGRPVTVEADEMLARILQHEIDHLDGKTILDTTDRKSREAALREFMSALAEEV